MRTKLQLRLLLCVAIVLGTAAPALANTGTAGMIEGGVGLLLPVADGNYRQDFGASPSLWLSGIYLPRYASRAFGVELGVELTPFSDDYQAQNGAQTEFTRLRIDIGGRYFRELAPKLIGVARVAAAVDMFSWQQTGFVGRLPFDDSDTDVGFGVELGAGAFYQLGGFSVGGQLVLPIGIHTQTVYDASPEMHYKSFDVELRLTVGTAY